MNKYKLELPIQTNDKMVMLTTRIGELLASELSDLALVALLSEALRLDVFRKKERDAAKVLLRAYKYTGVSNGRGLSSHTRQV